jgi:hypothetical protein
MGLRMSKPVAIDRLLQIGREITARVERLDKIGVKAVDHVDSINHLLAEAEKRCETAEVLGQRMPEPERCCIVTALIRGNSIL